MFLGNGFMDPETNYTLLSSVGNSLLTDHLYLILIFLSYVNFVSEAYIFDSLSLAKFDSSLTNERPSP